MMDHGTGKVCSNINAYMSAMLFCTRIKSFQRFNAGEPIITCMLLRYLVNHGP